MGGGGAGDSERDSGGDAPARRRGVPTWVMAVAAGALVGAAGVAIVIGLVLASRTPGPMAGYDAASEQRFLASCTADGGAPVRPACQCLYGEIVAAIAYPRFEELSEQLVTAQEAGEPFVLPPEIQALVPACRVPA